MLYKTDIPTLEFWEAVQKVIDHFQTVHRTVYIFSPDKLFYTVCVNQMNILDMVDNFTIKYGTGNDKLFDVAAQEECRTFIKKKGSIQVKPIQGHICTMKRPTLVVLYDAESWSEEDWEDFYYCKMEKFLDNGSDIIKVTKLGG